MDQYRAIHAEVISLSTVSDGSRVAWHGMACASLFYSLSLILSLIFSLVLFPFPLSQLYHRLHTTSFVLFCLSAARRLFLSSLRAPQNLYSIFVLSCLCLCHSTLYIVLLSSLHDGGKRKGGQNPYGTSDSRTLLLGIDHPSQSMLTTLLTDGEINYLDNTQKQSKTFSWSDVTLVCLVYIVRLIFQIEETNMRYQICVISARTVCESFQRMHASCFASARIRV